MNRLGIFVALLLASGLFAACEGLLGERTDTEFIDPPLYDSATVLFVPIQPFFGGFTNPSDVLFGFDELLYVVDEGELADANDNVIVQLDESGNELGRFAGIQGIHKLAQLRNLDLLALGTFDTTINGIPRTLQAVYRIRQVNVTSYGLQNATVVNKVVHPFYTPFSPVNSDFQPSLRFLDIDVVANDFYYVTRQGDNVRANSQDDAVVFFDSTDRYVTEAEIITSLGPDNTYFRSPTAIGTYAKPPQSPFVNEAGDFVVAQIDPNVSLRIQVMTYTPDPVSGDQWTLNTNLVLNDTTQAERFLYESDRFDVPTAITLTGDGTNYIFVADSVRDSVYLFTSTGLEGVRPPPGSNSSRNINVSFGGFGDGPLNFIDPMGLAHQRDILYVADRGNGRIGRYKLTTDFE